MMLAFSKKGAPWYVLCMCVRLPCSQVVADFYDRVQACDGALRPCA